MFKPLRFYRGWNIDFLYIYNFRGLINNSSLKVVDFRYCALSNECGELLIDIINKRKKNCFMLLILAQKQSVRMYQKQIAFDY